MTQKTGSGQPEMLVETRDVNRRQPPTAEDELYVTLSGRISRLPDDVLLARANTTELSLLGVDTELVRRYSNPKAAEETVQGIISNEVSRRALARIGSDDDNDGAYRLVRDYRPTQPDKFVDLLNSLQAGHADALQRGDPTSGRLAEAYHQAGTGTAQSGEYRLRAGSDVLTPNDLKLRLLQLDLDDSAGIKSVTDRQARQTAISSLVQTLGAEVNYVPGVLELAGGAVKSATQSVRDHAPAALTAAVLLGTAASVMPAVPAAAIESPVAPTKAVGTARPGLEQVPGDAVVVGAGPATLIPDVISPTTVPGGNPSRPSDTAPAASNVVTPPPAPVVSAGNLGSAVVIPSAPDTQPVAPQEQTPKDGTALPGIGPNGDCVIDMSPSNAFLHHSPGEKPIQVSPLPMPWGPPGENQVCYDQVPNPQQSGTVAPVPVASLAPATGGAVGGGQGEATLMPQTSEPTVTGNSADGDTLPPPAPGMAAPASPGQSGSNLSTNESSPAAPTLQQQTQGIIDLYTASMKANSIAELQGGAAQPNNPLDQMPDGLRETLKLMKGNMRAILGGDQSQIDNDAANWTNKVLQSDLGGTYTSDEHQLVTAIEAAAVALDAAGNHQDAAITRALGVYQLNSLMITTDQNLHAEFSTPPPSQPTSPSPPENTPGKTPEHFSGDRYSALLPNIVDRQKTIDGINAYIAARAPNSPMKGLGKYFVDGSEKWGVNPVYLVASAYLESQLCSDQGSVCAHHQDFNAWNRECPTDKPNVTYTDGYSGFHHHACLYLSFEDSLVRDDYTGAMAPHHGYDSFPQYMFRKYISKGKTTIRQILASFTPISETGKARQERLIHNYQVEMDNAYSYIGDGINFTSQPAPPSQSGHNPTPHETSGNSHPGLVRYYSQRDPAWKNVEFNNSTIEESGCGDTAFSMMLVNVKDRTDQNPASVADWSDSFKSEFRSSFVGETLARHGQQKFGYNYSLLHDNIDRVVTALQQGQTVIIGGRGDSRPYTSAGHIVYAYGITKGGNIIIADPYRTSYRGARNIYTPQQINNGMNYAVAFSP